MAQNKDYDAPRTKNEDPGEESLETVRELHSPARSGLADVEEDDTAEDFELPGADLSNEQLDVKIIPPGKDEFTCSSCFLVHHRSQVAAGHDGAFICTECFDPDTGNGPTVQAPHPVQPNVAGIGQSMNRNQGIRRCP